MFDAGSERSEKPSIDKVQPPPSAHDAAYDGGERRPKRLKPLLTSGISQMFDSSSKLPKLHTVLGMAASCLYDSSGKPPRQLQRPSDLATTYAWDHGDARTIQAPSLLRTTFTSGNAIVRK